MPVSLRLSEELSRRIARLVREKASNPHAFMVEAIREKVEAEEQQASFHAEARRRLDEMRASGRGLPSDEVFAYLGAKVHGERAKRPKARRAP